MIVAMYLTKDLMLDWRLGERVRNSVSPVLEVPTKFSCDCYSISPRCLSMPTSPRITEVGNGAQGLGRILNHTLGYSTRTIKAKRCSRCAGRRGLCFDNWPRLTQPEIIFGSSFLSLAVYVGQVGGMHTTLVILLTLF